MRMTYHLAVSLVIYYSFKAYNAANSGVFSDTSSQHKRGPFRVAGGRRVNKTNQKTSRHLAFSRFLFSLSAPSSPLFPLWHPIILVLSISSIVPSSIPSPSLLVAFGRGGSTVVRIRRHSRQQQVTRIPRTAREPAAFQITALSDR